MPKMYMNEARRYEECRELAAALETYFGGQDVAGGAALGRSIYVLLDESSYIPHTEGKAKWTDPSTPARRVSFLFFFFFGAGFLTSQASIS